ncbi:MAG TPA: hypothetical protein VGJ64_01380, partial [Gemmatimonadaceae bacterium]
VPRSVKLKRNGADVIARVYACREEMNVTSSALLAQRLDNIEHSFDQLTSGGAWSAAHLELTTRFIRETPVVAKRPGGRIVAGCDLVPSFSGRSCSDTAERTSTIWLGDRDDAPGGDIHRYQLELGADAEWAACRLRPRPEEGLDFGAKRIDGEPCQVSGSVGFASASAK